MRVMKRGNNDTEMMYFRDGYMKKGFVPKEHVLSDETGTKRRQLIVTRKFVPNDQDEG